MGGERLSEAETVANPEGRAKWELLYEKIGPDILEEVASRFNDLPKDIIDGARVGVYRKLLTHFKTRSLDEEHFSGLVARATEHYILSALEHLKTGMGHLNREEPGDEDSGGDPRTIEDTVADTSTVESEVDRRESAVRIAEFYASLTPLETRILDDCLSRGIDNNDSIVRIVGRKKDDVPGIKTDVEEVRASRAIIAQKAVEHGLAPAPEEVVA